MSSDRDAARTRRADGGRHWSAREIGILGGIGAYALWGMFPLYFHALKPTGAVEILAHRVVWSFVLMVAILTVRRQWGWVRGLIADRRRLARIWLAGLLLATNWLTYVWAVNADRVVDASLGYFVNPIITVVIGVVVLGEQVRPLQKAAIALGAVSVVVLTAGYGELPWIALVLSLSFAGYGLFKKQVGLDALASLTAETSLLFPVAAIGLIWSGALGETTFGHHGAFLDAKLLALGVVTAVPLVLFGVATQRIPLVMIGLLQYLTPWGQFLLGWLYFGEDVSLGRLAGFVLIWGALVVLGIDGWRASRQVDELPGVTVAPSGSAGK